MYVLILTLVFSATAAPAMTTAEFSSQQACFDAANAWKGQAKFTFPDAKLTAVCMPK